MTRAEKIEAAARVLELCFPEDVAWPEVEALRIALSEPPTPPTISERLKSPTLRAEVAKARERLEEGDAPSSDVKTNGK